MNDTVLFDVKDHLAVITLNEPDSMNTFTHSLIAGLTNDLGILCGDDNITGQH